MMARVAIEFTPAVTQGGGVARSVYGMTAALLEAASHDYTLFVAGKAALPLEITRHNPQIKRAPLSATSLTRLWHRIHLPLPVEAFVGRTDLYFATDFALAPHMKRTKTAVFIHDLTFARVPDAAVPSLVGYLSGVVPRSIRNSDVVVVNSESTKADIIALYGTPEDHIIPVQFGVDSRFKPSTDGLNELRAKYALPERPYILSVGTVQPRKNYARLISALGQLRRNGLDVSLVIAGGKGWLDTPIYETICAERLESTVIFLGYVDDFDLPALYSSAAVFAMPSLYEGFGLPVLEAMACGTPVVTSTVSSLPEAAGNAALLVDPTSVDAIADALQKLLTDSSLRETLVSRGTKRAAEFMWKRTARQLESAFKLALTR